jgi:hypothetical protein
MVTDWLALGVNWETFLFKGLAVKGLWSHVQKDSLFNMEILNILMATLEKSADKDDVQN